MKSRRGRTLAGMAVMGVLSGAVAEARQDKSANPPALPSPATPTTQPTRGPQPTPPGQPAPGETPAPTTPPPPADGAPPLDQSKPWRVNLSVGAWMTAMKGDVGVRGFTADVDASFGDILQESDSILAFSGRLEVGYEKFGGYLDGFWAKLGADDQTGPLGLSDIDVVIKQGILDFGVMYRIGDWKPTGAAAANAHNLSLDLYGGGRYSDIDVKLDPALLASRSRRESWVDPLVGAKLVVPIAQSWVFMINGDIGGFGVESDLTWSTTAVFGYDFHIGTLPTTVFMGYRAIGWDFSTGSGTDEFKWQMVEHGPVLGLTFRF